MSGLSSPPRFLPPISPRRAPSPTMSPGGRRGRTTGTSEESRLRDLSPNTTLRAFTELPIPYDTTSDEYKIFACVENLTPAERDLGARVAKAAQRLKNWCQEIEQWGWSGSFEQPSEEYREKRRKSLELRIREHVKDVTAIESIGPLEYWGSLLSVEVEAHEARLDEISEELLELDIEELKEHVLDIHGPNRSRPSSAGYEASRQNYTLMDDFSFLITQTLLSALPHHFQLKDRLNTWTARVSVLREAPRYLGDLKTAQKAMKLGWNAIEPPGDPSDATFDKWKEAVETISGVLQGKVSDLGQRLDRMLDTLEGRQDCLPDDWIDIFEGVEGDFGRWVHASRKRIIEFDVRRKVEQNELEPGRGDDSENQTAHSDQNHVSKQHAPTMSNGAIVVKDQEGTDDNNTKPRSVTAIRTDIPEAPRSQLDSATEDTPQQQASEPDSSPVEDSIFEEGDTVVHNEVEQTEDSFSSTSDVVHVRSKSISFSDSPIIITTEEEPAESVPAEEMPAEEMPTEEMPTEEMPTEEMPTEEIPIEKKPIDEEPTEEKPVEEKSIEEKPIEVEPTVEKPTKEALPDRPQTPRSRRGSIESISSNISFSSGPPSVIEESPSIRNRQARPPRPDLNAAMGKRRPNQNAADLSIDSNPPWPPTQFSKQLSPNSSDDLDRKISDILESIPAHIRLTSRAGTEVQKQARGGVSKRGSKGYLRAARSFSGMKSPELTLSPAKSDFESANVASGRKSTASMRGDNEIKLYHLTQPGKEHPIKLFIRRVGENGERVMVRVGGGWADLGEYLRQYAEHHGRRTVSDGKFEILGLEVKNPDGSPRPESAMSKRDRRFSGGHSGSPNTTPSKSAGIGISKDEPAPPMPNFTSTPSGANGEKSTPSTGSSRHSWQGNEVGLAGPKAKKLDLSGEKLEWIEGMMKQARTVSGNMSAPKPEQHREGGESRSESRSAGRKSDFGDLGKVGGTKRVFWKGGALSEH